MVLKNRSEIEPNDNFLNLILISKWKFEDVFEVSVQK